jgi:hypothetical protein
MWVLGLFRRSPVKALCWLNAPLSYMGTLLTVPLWALVPALSLYANVHPVRALSRALHLHTPKAHGEQHAPRGRSTEHAQSADEQLLVRSRTHAACHRHGHSPRGCPFS